MRMGYLATSNETGKKAGKQRGERTVKFLEGRPWEPQDLRN